MGNSCGQCGSNKDVNDVCISNIKVVKNVQRIPVDDKQSKIENIENNTQTEIKEQRQITEPSLDGQDVTNGSGERHIEIIIQVENQQDIQVESQTQNQIENQMEIQVEEIISPLEQTQTHQNSSEDIGEHQITESEPIADVIFTFNELKQQDLQQRGVSEIPPPIYVLPPAPVYAPELMKVNDSGSQTSQTNTTQNLHLIRAEENQQTIDQTLIFRVVQRLLQSSPAENLQFVPYECCLEKWTELGALNFKQLIQKNFIQLQELKTYSQKFKSIDSKADHDLLYEGQYDEKDNIPYGVVRITEKDKGMYEGQFSNCQYNGFGRYIYEYGQYYVGWYKNGKMHGYGKYVQGDGRVSEGMWEEGNFQSELEIDQNQYFIDSDYIKKLYKKTF